MRSVIMIVLSLFVLSAFVHTPEKSEAVNVVKPKKANVGSSMPVLSGTATFDPKVLQFPQVQDTSAPIFDSYVNRGVVQKSADVCTPGQDCGQRGFTPRADRISTPFRGRVFQGRLFNGRVRGFFARFGCRGC